MREQEARELAARADLLIFVLDHDLVRTEFDPFSALVRQGKRSIVLLNKSDRFTDADRDAILAKLRERLRGLVPPDDVIVGAASPRPIPVRVRREDGTTETSSRTSRPSSTALRDRIAQVLKREGDVLRAGNLLLRRICSAARPRTSSRRNATAAPRKSSRGSSGSPPPRRSPIRSPRWSCWPAARSSTR